MSGSERTDDARCRSAGKHRLSGRMRAVLQLATGARLLHGARDRRSGRSMHAANHPADNDVVPSDTQLAVVMPIYNEDQNIEAVLREWNAELGRLAIPFCFLVVNDGSTDRTAEILRTLAVESDRVIPINKTNSGHGRTCRVGYDLAARSAAEWVLQVDSDGQCDAQYFGAFWEARENADCVFGVRTSRGDGLIRHLISVVCTMSVRLLTGARVRDANVPYRLMRRALLARALARIPADFDVHNVALAVALDRTPGVRWRFIPIRFRARRVGENSIDVRKIARLGTRMLQELRRIRRFE